LPHARQAAAHRPPIHEDPDKIYIDVAGLVLLWPFLATYFERLDLLSNPRVFRDDAARARAVILLQYLATSDPDPPDFRLSLAKVLCGVSYDDFILLPKPLTEAELSEGTNLLSAVLQHAKVFGEISGDDFREGFLLRRGILTTRDGSWLLRVERAPYDMILQHLPWPLSWVRLPWMQAPLCVEWTR
jgi:Contractile injection system tape measure protein